MGSGPADDDPSVRARDHALDATVPGDASGATGAFAATRPSDDVDTSPRRARATTPPHPVAADLAPGDRIGRFLLLELLGVGGMGAVFAARDTELERRVAIKVVRRRDGRLPGANLRARLLREAQAAARLSHRNVVTIHEVGTIDDGPATGQVFVAMELVDGETLARWHERPRPWRDVVGVYLQAARGLAAAHAAGLVHRDFKPDNALLGKDGEVRVTDFGLASVSGASVSADGDAAAPAASPVAGVGRLTSTGDVMGTPLFMAPEQRAGAPVDARADQYALCVALYRALYAVYPFGAASEVELARRADALELSPPPPGRRVPRAVHRAIVRGLAPAPADRWADLPALIAALERALGARRRRVTAASIGAAGAAFAATAWLAASDRAAPAAACTTARAELAVVWNDAARARGAAGLAASGLGDADAAWRRVAAAIDAWGHGWITAHTAACRATRVHRRDDEATLARRQACLASQRDVLAGVLALWATADRETAARATEAVLRLPPTAACAAPPPLPDGARGEATAALRARLGELHAAGIAGRFVEELPRAAAALAEARALGDRGLEAEAGLLLGRFQRAAADEAARTTLFDAAATAEAAGRDDLAVEAWSDWIYVAASSGVAAAEVQAASRRAEAALVRAGGDRRLRAILRNNQGVAAYEAERDEEALRLFDEALALRIELFGRDDPRTADILDNIGNAHAGVASTSSGEARARAHDDELRANLEAYEIRRRTLGDTSVAVARSLHNVGIALDSRGRYEEAEDYLRRALATKEVAMGPTHPGLGSTLVRIGMLMIRLGRYREALAAYERAVALWDGKRGPVVGPLCTPLQGVYEALIGLGRPAEAVAPALRCAELRADEPTRRRRQLLAAALAQLEAGDEAAALVGLRELVAAEAESYALDDPRRLRGLAALARAELAAGRARQAADTLARAEKLVPAAEDLEPAVRADVLLTRAELTAALGGRAAARAAAAAALAPCDGGACTYREPGLRARAARLR